MSCISEVSAILVSWIWLMHSQKARSRAPSQLPKFLKVEGKRDEDPEEDAEETGNVTWRLRTTNWKAWWAMRIFTRIFVMEDEKVGARSGAYRS